MLASAVRRTITARAPLTAVAVATRTQRAPVTATVPSWRCFSSDLSGIRRPKPVKVKKGEARRRVEPKPKAEHTDALVQHQEVSQAPVEYSQGPFSPPQTPQSFGGMMKESFLWGIGMALAFTFVGVIFSAMEEADAPGMYDGSDVVAYKDEVEE